MRIALVTPWFGPELIGGAERLAWDLSRALARANVAVEVLTTCCRSFHDDWAANYHRPGMRTIDGIAVRRFRVDARDRVAFSRANSALLSLRQDQLRRDRRPLPPEQTDAFLTDGIRSRALVQHLRTHGDAYDAFVFLPYLYGTTIDGLPVVADRAFLLPCLHDEAYAYLDAMRALFRQARGLLFNSDGELDVAAALYGPWVHARAYVVGHAVDILEPPKEPITIKGFAPHRSRYLLFLGRGDRTKNLELAVEAFVRFRGKRRATALQFVVAGPHARHLRQGEGIVDLGAVTEEAKAALLAGARALVQPSTNESFSRTVYEAWHLRRPVVVHGDCAATARIVAESGGGWIARTVDEWAEVFAMIDESSDAFVDGVGLRGRAAALENGTWETVVARILEAIDERLGRIERPRIEQIVPLGFPEVTRYAHALDAALRAYGCHSAIAIEGGPALGGGAKTIRHVVDAAPAAPADAYVLHSPDGNAPRDVPIFLPHLGNGQVPDHVAARSRFLPRPVDLECWASIDPAGLPSHEGNTLLSLAPLDSAEAERLIEIFALVRKRIPDARLLIPEETCPEMIRSALTPVSSTLGLEESIVFIGTSPEARYAALRGARIACCLGLPPRDPYVLAEAMWFDLPIIAYDDPIARETLESSCILCRRGSPEEVAGLLSILARDHELQSQIFAEMRRARQQYTFRAAVHCVLDALRALPHQPSPVT